METPNGFHSATTMENDMEVPQKTKSRTYDSSIPFLGAYPKKTKP